MSTSIAISAAAYAQAAAASAAAHQARVQACEVMVKSFDAKAATVAEQKTYAECVQLLHPDPMPHSTEIALKASIVIVLVAMVVGAVQGYRGEHYSDGGLVDTSLLSVMYAFGAACFIGALALVCLGVAYVVSG